MLIAKTKSGRIPYIDIMDSDALEKIEGVLDISLTCEGTVLAKIDVMLGVNGKGYHVKAENTVVQSVSLFNYSVQAIKIRHVVAMNLLNELEDICQGRTGLHV